MKIYTVLFFITTLSFADQTFTLKDPPKKSNRVSILGGVGPGQQFSVSTASGVTDVKNKLGLVYGIQYDRRVEQTSTFVGGQLQSNGTFLVSFGAEF